MTDWTTVCQLTDIDPDTGVCALVNGEQVAVFRWGNSETLYAINNFDPFGKANVLSRGIVGSIGERPVVASPLYKQHFDLSTGECLEDDSVAVKRYQVKVEGGTVLLA
ncbi:MAG: nitrite reductase small subunit [Oceanospirillaceae bacterium]|uniref:nitrite reductase small subunit NirD n=1 Tax=unclassified Thalassolituus TaxID=2624967 RepID=UPI000C6315A5|nr:MULTISPECIES: nitrite reductase small subunit NirD [unclassified Thalassolituus]MAS25104.1 nitrite reductase small subunit [Oceanospirillaceae bacterium]MAX97970.1 nitrite reductase small subunit [Oceanospirillaceae bacterium]MBS52130.1 nitrite reductase small subunit [Oceanospirillaceae bacterium]|tara:strand:+ start:33 stop:356 length:324 start_codon:yes stop_codon:yes gene_type:complete